MYPPTIFLAGSRPLRQPSQSVQQFASFDQRFDVASHECPAALVRRQQMGVHRNSADHLERHAGVSKWLDHALQIAQHENIPASNETLTEPCSRRRRTNALETSSRFDSQHFGQDVRFADDLDVVAVHFDVGAGVFAVNHQVADRQPTDRRACRCRAICPGPRRPPCRAAVFPWRCRAARCRRRSALRPRPVPRPRDHPGDAVSCLWPYCRSPIMLW